MDKVIPLRDYILVDPIDEKAETAGGIVLPDSAVDKPTKGTVLAVGKGRLLPDGKYVKLDYGVGDNILFRPHGGIEVVVNDTKKKVLRDDEVLGIITGGENDAKTKG